MIPVLMLFSLIQLLKNSAINGRDTLRRYHILELQNALTRFNAQTYEYPTSLDQLVQSSNIKVIPVDPLTNKPYQYTLLRGGKDYQICVYLERQNETRCVKSLDYSNKLLR